MDFPSAPKLPGPTAKTQSLDWVKQVISEICGLAALWFREERIDPNTPASSVIYRLALEVSDIPNASSSVWSDLFLSAALHQSKDSECKTFYRFMTRAKLSEFKTFVEEQNVEIPEPQDFVLPPSYFPQKTPNLRLLASRHSSPQRRSGSLGPTSSPVAPRSQSIFSTSPLLQPSTHQEEEDSTRRPAPITFPLEPQPSDEITRPRRDSRPPPFIVKIQPRKGSVFSGGGVGVGTSGAVDSGGGASPNLRPIGLLERTKKALIESIVSNRFEFATQKPTSEDRWDTNRGNKEFISAATPAAVAAAAPASPSLLSQSFSSGTSSHGSNPPPFAVKIQPRDEHPISSAENLVQPKSALLASVASHVFASRSRASSIVTNRDFAGLQDFQGRVRASSIMTNRDMPDFQGRVSYDHLVPKSATPMAMGDQTTGIEVVNSNQAVVSVTSSPAAAAAAVTMPNQPLSRYQQWLTEQENKLAKMKVCEIKKPVDPVKQRNEILQRRRSVGKSYTFDRSLSPNPSASSASPRSPRRAKTPPASFRPSTPFSTTPSSPPQPRPQSPKIVSPAVNLRIQKAQFANVGPKVSSRRAESPKTPRSENSTPTINPQPATSPSLQPSTELVETPSAENISPFPDQSLLVENQPDSANQEREISSPPESNPEKESENLPEFAVDTQILPQKIDGDALTSEEDTQTMDRSELKVETLQQRDEEASNDDDSIEAEIELSPHSETPVPNSDPASNSAPTAVARDSGSVGGYSALDIPPASGRWSPLVSPPDPEVSIQTSGVSEDVGSAPCHALPHLHSSSDSLVTMSDDAPATPPLPPSIPPVVPSTTNEALEQPKNYLVDQNQNEMTPVPLPLPPSELAMQITPTLPSPPSPSVEKEPKDDEICEEIQPMPITFTLSDTVVDSSSRIPPLDKVENHVSVEPTDAASEPAADSEITSQDQPEITTEISSPDPDRLQDSASSPQPPLLQTHVEQQSDHTDNTSIVNLNFEGESIGVQEVPKCEESITTGSPDKHEILSEEERSKSQPLSNTTEQQSETSQVQINENEESVVPMLDLELQQTPNKVHKGVANSNYGEWDLPGTPEEERETIPYNYEDEFSEHDSVITTSSSFSAANGAILTPPPPLAPEPLSIDSLRSSAPLRLTTNGDHHVPFVDFKAILRTPTDLQQQDFLFPPPHHISTNPTILNNSLPVDNEAPPRDLQKSILSPGGNLKQATRPQQVSPYVPVMYSPQLSLSPSYASPSATYSSKHGSPPKSTSTSQRKSVPVFSSSPPRGGGQMSPARIASAVSPRGPTTSRSNQARASTSPPQRAKSPTVSKIPKNYYLEILQQSSVKRGSSSPIPSSQQKTFSLDELQNMSPEKLSRLPSSPSQLSASLSPRQSKPTSRPHGALYQPHPPTPVNNQATSHESPRQRQVSSPGPSKQALLQNLATTGRLLPTDRVKAVPAASLISPFKKKT